MASMRPNDLLEHLRRRPFQPFIMTLTDGRSYAVHHPELAMVGLSTVLLGLPARDTRDPVFERTVTVSLQHIMQIEPVGSATTSPSNGGP
jgi:hypothetical protein